MGSSSINTKTKVFLRMLNEDHLYLCSSLDYQTVCSMLDVLPEELDKALEETVGHDGKTLMQLMKKDYIPYIKKKYSLKVGKAR